MEKNTSIVVYYSYQKNKIIEDRIREYYPQVKEYNPLRLDILEYALDDLERIHNRRVNLLFEFDKPIIG